jgi:hypothetical protein
MSRPPDDAGAPDAFALRFEQALVSVVLLAGFVFRIVWVLPVVALVIAGALLGPTTDGPRRLYQALFGERSAVGHPAEPPALTRLTRLVELGLLAVAMLFVLAGAAGFGWVFALAAAAITLIGSTTGVNLVALVRDRRKRGR